jgi:hypothetical protein
MAGLGLAALAMAFASLIEQQSGVAIAVVDPGQSLSQASDEARLEICGKLGIEPCTLSPEEFWFSASANGQAFSHEIAFPDGRVRQGCVVVLPDSSDDYAGTDWIETQYGVSDPAQRRALNAVPDQTLDALNALTQVASCARRADVDDQIEAARELAFSALASELSAASADFLMTPSASLGGSISSDAAEIGTSVGRRILIEYWKGELARQVEGRGHCRAKVIPARQPVVQPPAATRPSRELLGCLGSPAEWGVAQGTVVEVSDATIASLSVGDDDNDLLERFERQTTGLPMQSDLEPLRALIFEPTPFPGFQSIEQGLLYSWQVSGQIVGQD